MYDISAGIGGLLHYQLPDSSLHPERATEKPFMFADTGLKILVKQMLSMGARKENFNTTVTGGASIAMAPKGFDIGKRNHLAVRKIMWKMGIPIRHEDVGGGCPRNLYLDIANGQVMIKTCRPSIN
jgi:chemotaxis protein CheD